MPDPSENANDADRQTAVMSAVVTEHFVLQSAAAATVSEMGTRASLYILALSSALVAMGFTAQSREVFIPFVATVAPAIVLLGLFTVVRLVDAAMEYNELLAGIARIRRYYRSLSPTAAELFAAPVGRWPETEQVPTLRLGVFIAFVTTTASMVAFINSFVAGAGVAILVANRLGAGQRSAAIALGSGVAVALMAVFLLYQRWRYSLPLPGTERE
jgi:hypothetical protein